MTLTKLGRPWSSCAALLIVGLAGACSDDGVPADETSAGEGGTTAEATATDPTTQTTSVSDTVSSSGTTDPTGPNPTASDSDITTATDPTGIDTSGEGTTAVDESSSSATDDGTSGSSDATTDAGSSSEESGGGILPVGDPCEADAECATGVCWDLGDYDPACGGTACSGPCRGDDDCVALIMDAGGDGEASMCGADGRCTMVGTGLGAFFCEGG